MTYLATAADHRQVVADADAAVRFLDERAHVVHPWNTRGSMIEFGPAAPGDAHDVTGPPPLRVHIDIDAGRAALRWQPDASYGIELPATDTPIRSTSGTHYAVVSGHLARVSIDTARRAVAEYVSSGQQPTCLSWERIYMGWVEGDSQALPDADSAIAFVDQQAQMIQPWGTSGNRIVLGPATDEDEWATGPLQIDIDPDAGRAALRWRPDATYAVELEPADKPINTSGWGEPATVAPELARVSIPGVHRAVAEYITTGQRPTFLDWSPV